MPGASPKRSRLRDCGAFAAELPKVHHNYGVCDSPLRADSKKPPRNSGSRSAQLPPLADAHYELATCAHEQGRNSEALACYEAGDPPCFLILLSPITTANILTIFGRTDEALPITRRSARDPIFPDCPIQLGPILSPASVVSPGRAALRSSCGSHPGLFPPTKIAHRRV